MTQGSFSIHSSDAHLAEIAQLHLKVAYLEERCLELVGMVGKNSQNSSKHSSSDGYQKPNKNDDSQHDGAIGKDSDSPHESPDPKTLRQSSGKKAGGEKGHKRSCLRSVDNPDHVVYHTIQECQHCHASLYLSSPGPVIQGTISRPQHLLGRL